MFYFVRISWTLECDRALKCLQWILWEQQVVKLLTVMREIILGTAVENYWDLKLSTHTHRKREKKKTFLVNGKRKSHVTMFYKSSGASSLSLCVYVRMCVYIHFVLCYYFFPGPFQHFHPLVGMCFSLNNL